MFNELFKIGGHVLEMFRVGTIKKMKFMDIIQTYCELPKNEYNLLQNKLRANSKKNQATLSEVMEGSVQISSPVTFMALIRCKLKNDNCAKKFRSLG